MQALARKSLPQKEQTPMKPILVAMLFGFWLLAIGIGSKIGSLILLGGALIWAAPAVGVVYYAWLILFRPPGK